MNQPQAGYDFKAPKTLALGRPLALRATGGTFGKVRSKD